MEMFARDGDRAAYEELVRRWDSRLVAFLMKASGNFEAARDLRQEVFLRIYKYGSTYDPAFAFTTWMFRIVNNVLATWRQREAKRAFTPWDADRLAQAPDFARGPRERAELKGVGHEIRDAIARLESAERELILLRLDLELSYKEISDILGEPETTLKSRFYALMRRLKELLAESGITGVEMYREQQSTEPRIV
jgi:RNA polymerase sigma-70 factor (ECF subfamily)